MKKNDNANYCIIGSGFAGTATFVHFIEKLVENQYDLCGVTISIVEPRPEPGPGLAYSMEETLPTHLCNNQASSMAIKGNDFVDWMYENRKRLLISYPHLISVAHPAINLNTWEPDGEAFYPRQLFGIYLNERWLEAKALAECRGASINLLNGYRAIDGYMLADKFVLLVEEESSKSLSRLYNLDKVLLSIGHWLPKSKFKKNLWCNESCFKSPYPTKNITNLIENKIKNNSIVKIYIQGMGPSGIDAILTAAEHGDFTYSKQGRVLGYNPNNHSKLKIIVASRSGYFPAARSTTLDYKFKYITKDFFEKTIQNSNARGKLEKLLNLIDKEIKGTTDGEFGLEHVLKPQFKNAYDKLKFDVNLPTINSIIHTIILKVRRLKFYRYLEAKEKKYYDSFLDSHFIRTAVPIPLLNAEKLIALFEADVLESVTLGNELEIQWNYDHSLKKATAKSLGDKGKQDFDICINASGQNFLIDKHPSPLIHILLKRGEIIAYNENNYIPGGIALESNETYRVVKKQFHNGYGHANHSSIVVSNYLYSFGVPTRFWQNERNFAGAIIEAASWISEEWASHYRNVMQKELNRQTQAALK